MDETLIHAMIHEPEEEGKVEDCDFSFILPGGLGESDLLVSVKERPYWQETLTHLSQLYEIVVFTAGT